MPKEQKASLPIDLSSLPPEEVAKSMAETVMVEKILRDARTLPPVPKHSVESIREGEEFMATMRLGSEAALLSQIDRGELITRDVLVTRLGGDSRWVNEALKAGRIFSLLGPSGVDHFPSFFADSTYDRRAIGRVSKVLALLPGPSKYFFLTNKSFMLGMTPLEALVEGRVKDVLVCASGFAVR